MKTLKNITCLFFCILTFIACKPENNNASSDNFEKEIDTITEEVVLIEVEKTTKQLKEELTAEGYQTFDYVDAKTQDTILMQQYFMAFLKSGPIRSQNEEEAAKLQEAHMAHLGRMYEEGFADLIGPFGDDTEFRGVTVYNVPTLKMADSLANLDPMVKAGRLVIEVHPWWVAKGFSLR